MPVTRARFGQSPRSPHQISRRSSIILGTTGLGTTGLLALGQRRAPAADAPEPTAKNCILIWLNGGLSHLDTFDLKPEAPREVRGEFKSIRSKLDGVLLSEHLPRTGDVLDRCTLLRAVTSLEGNHDRATRYMLTGWRPTPALEYPALGCVVARETKKPAELPPYIAIPAEIKNAGCGYLSAEFEPFVVGGDPASRDFRVRDLHHRAPRDRFERRRRFLSELEGFSERLAGHPTDPHLEQAYRFIDSEAARRAFDLELEPPESRQRYGRTKLGQSCLLARRLVEAGARCVTVNDGGWDHHVNIFRTLSTGFPGKLPELDRAFAALIEDLDAHGLLQETLVVLMSDFGRTPKLNESGGRDHWPRAGSVVLAGGGVQRGYVHGRTDAHGELPADGAVSPADLAATIYHTLGIARDKEYRTPRGRPVAILDGGRVVEEIL